MSLKYGRKKVNAAISPPKTAELKIRAATKDEVDAVVACDARSDDLGIPSACKKTTYTVAHIVESPTGAGVVVDEVSGPVAKPQLSSPLSPSFLHYLV